MSDLIPCLATIGIGYYDYLYNSHNWIPFRQHLGKADSVISGLVTAGLTYGICDGLYKICHAWWDFSLTGFTFSLWAVIPFYMYRMSYSLDKIFITSVISGILLNRFHHNYLMPYIFRRRWNKGTDVAATLLHQLFSQVQNK